ncbi:uncharacterized protein LOC113467487 [Diaphorina citri]|uniref:Uncharacterized protein LOC113467487 n=1 Tax=Diaphorina citri TaxID=121845 RepID=A0A3Q0ITA3_DIACI|nr:uncharacterized protein LOC113467487 [Diaphorina citri]
MKNGETPIVQSSNVPDKPRNPCNKPTNIPKLPPNTLPRTYQNPCEKQQIYVSQYQNSSPMYAKQNLPVSTASRYQDIIEQCRSSYNTPNHSFELYNKLLDHFYKFCDTVLAKHGLDKTTPLQKRQVEQNELVVRNATMDALRDILEQSKRVEDDQTRYSQRPRQDATVHGATTRNEMSTSITFSLQGDALDKFAKKTVKVLVVGNPANTNALICSKYAPSIPKENFSAMTRLDQNRYGFYR